jgi:hypothetical protein
VDVPHYLTLGLLDLSNALFVIFKRTSISLPDSYSSFVLPIDVDESGMMKQDKYVRNASYAIRKLWLKTGLEKECSSAGFSIECVSRSMLIKDPLGVYSRYRIRSQVVSVRDEVDSFFVEQKFVSGSENHVHATSYIQFKFLDNNAHLRRPDAPKIKVSKVFAHALTRRMAPSTKRGVKGKGNKLVAKNEDADKIYAEIATMCMEESVKPDLMKYISYTCGVDKITSPFKTDPLNASQSQETSSASSGDTSSSTSSTSTSTAADASNGSNSTSSSTNTQTEAANELPEAKKTK